MPPRGPLAAALATLALLTLLGAHPAAAGRQWCRTDPIVVIAGTRVNIEAAVPVEDQGAVNGPVMVVVSVPVGVAAEVVYVDAGFNGHSEHVTIHHVRHLQAQEGAVPIQVEITVPASRDDVPVAAWVTPAEGRAASVVGRANLAVPVYAASVTPSA